MIVSNVAIIVATLSFFPCFRKFYVDFLSKKILYFSEKVLFLSGATACTSFLAILVRRV